jgi:hypothetical protein
MNVLDYKKEAFSSRFSSATSIELVRVATVDGYTYHFSRLEGETEWYLDAKFKGILPLYVHGKGSRSCRKETANTNVKKMIAEFILRTQK